MIIIVMFSYNNECNLNDEQSMKLPFSFTSPECYHCDKGYYLKYAFELNKLICDLCPENYYSNGGAFVIRGDHYEWTEERLEQFKNKCYSSDIKGNIEPNCKAFTSNGQYITTNNAYNTDQYQYAVQLSFKVTIVKKGELKFEYQKGFAIEKGLISGIFRLIVNYISVFEDYSNTIKWTKYKYPLEPGQYSIMFFYIKYVISEETKDLSLRIKSLEIEGIDTSALECLPCIGGTSDPGSTSCRYCNEGKYFDATKKECIECPMGTTSKYKSVGKESCLRIPDCTDNSYQKIVSPLCNKQTNQHKVHYELIQNDCNEVNPPKDSTIQCYDCPIGNYWSEIAKDPYHLKCIPCLNGRYTSKSNQYSCSPCEGILSKITYFTPQESKLNKMAFDIEIENFEGEMHVAYNQIDNRKEIKVEVFVDNVIVKSILHTPDKTNEKIQVPVGVHNIQITSSNVIISTVSVTNTKTGGGYLCSPCSNGFLIKKDDELICRNCGAGFELNQKEECTPCPQGHYKYSNNHFDKCVKCPLLALPNESKTGCEPFEVMTNSKYKTRIHLSKFQQTRDYLCNITNNLCESSFYGPIKDNEKHLYFISYDKAALFSNQAFSYTFNEQKANAFIYQLVNDDKATAKSNNLLHSKFVVNLGKDISSIKIMNGKLNKGVVMRYSNGDICKQDSTQRYQSVILFVCPQQVADDDSIFEGISESYAPKFIKKNNCVYYFKWPSRSACPICLTSQVKRFHTPCKGFSRYVYYSEKANCIISNTTGLKGSLVNAVNNEAMVTIEKDSDILTEYSISDAFNELKEEKQQEKEMEGHDDEDEDNGNDDNKGYKEANQRKDQVIYIESPRIQETCYLYDDFDNKILIVIIAIPIVYLIIALIFVCVCCKYCKLRGDYHRLVEDPGSTDNLNMSNVHSNNINQEIELGSIVNTNSNKQPL